MATPQEITAWIQAATQSTIAGNFPDARAWCARVLADQPSNLAGLQILGQIEQRSNNVAGAIEAFERARRVDPQNTNTLLMLGWAHQQAGSHRPAIEAFEQLARQNAAPDLIYEQLGLLYVFTEQPARGIALLLEADRQRPDTPGILVALCRLNRHVGALVEAISFGEKAVQKAPASFSARHTLASAYLNHGSYEKAFALLRNQPVTADMQPQARKLLGETLADTEMVIGIRNAWSAAGITLNADELAGPRGASERAAVAGFSAQIGTFDGRGLNVVFFHVASDDKHPFLVGSNEVDYAGSLAAACAAARKASPTANIIVLTDEKTELSFLPASVRVLRAEMDSSLMMYSRMSSYRAALMTKMLRGPTIFLDTDVCLIRDFRALFDGSFDIALTYRSQPAFWHMPVNEGVLMVADGASPEAARFFGESLARYDWLSKNAAVAKRYGFSVKKWRGGQLSLGMLVDWKVPPFGADTQTLRGLRYRFFDGNDFNYPVAPSDNAASLAKKWAAHFKGKAVKKMMAPFEEALSG